MIQVWWMHASLTLSWNHFNYDATRTIIYNVPYLGRNRYVLDTPRTSLLSKPSLQHYAVRLFNRSHASAGSRDEEVQLIGISAHVLRDWHLVYSRHAYASVSFDTWRSVIPKIMASNDLLHHVSRYFHADFTVCQVVSYIRSLITNVPLRVFSVMSVLCSFQFYSIVSFYIFFILVKLY